MNGTFNQAWTYVAEERTAEYQRKAARQQLLDQAQSRSHATGGVPIFQLAHKLKVRLSTLRRGETAASVPIFMGGDRTLVQTD